MATDILAQIAAVKQEEVQRGLRQTPLARQQQAAQDAAPPRPFAAALADARAGAKSTALPVIAELKRRSPSKGVLCDPFVPREIAAAYAAGGAACLSVLTDAEFFGGSADDLRAARTATSLPVLRKDFMLHPWQIYESRAMGADAVLLIVAMLEDAMLEELADIAHGLGLAVLVEVHDGEELQRALRLPPHTLLGINNRNLKTFHTTVQTTFDLLPAARAANAADADTRRLLVCESGIHDSGEVQALQQAGVDAFLIGEALVRDPQGALARLFKGE